MKVHYLKMTPVAAFGFPLADVGDFHFSLTFNFTDGGNAVASVGDQLDMTVGSLNE